MRLVQPRAARRADEPTRGRIGGWPKRLSGSFSGENAFEVNDGAGDGGTLELTGMSCRTDVTCAGDVLPRDGLTGTDGDDSFGSGG